MGRKCRSTQSVHLAEGAGEHDRHEENAGTEHEDMLRVAQVKDADAADENISYREVEEGPKLTLTVGEERPSPGGVANGLWKAIPEIPWTR